MEAAPELSFVQFFDLVLRASLRPIRLRSLPSNILKRLANRLVMSILSRLRNARRAAQERRSEISTSTDPAPKPVQYRHIPTHAASDSLGCAPPGWREAEDRKAIQAQHARRRGMSKSASGLSVVTTLHRGDSYNSDDWTMTTIDQRNGPIHTSALPGSGQTRRLSPLHAAGTEHPLLITTWIDNSSRITFHLQLRRYYFLRVVKLDVVRRLLP